MQEQLALPLVIRSERAFADADIVAFRAEAHPLYYVILRHDFEHVFKPKA